jgi:hypothetical protein
MPALPLIDHRRPGVQMAPVPVKLPPDLLEALQAQADRLGCSRGALARALIDNGLEQLQGPAGEVA